MMARNYFKIACYFCQIVRSSSQGFVTTSQTKSTTFSVRMMKSSQQPVHDETFSRLHALFRSFKTQFKHTFTTINSTYSLSFNIVNVLFKMTDEVDIPKLLMSFYETQNYFINKLSLMFFPACLILRWKTRICFALFCFYFPIKEN